MAEGYQDNPMGVINGYMTWKTIQGTTNQYGLIDVGVTTNSGNVICATNISGSDDGYVAIPYRINQVNSAQYLCIYKATTTGLEPMLNKNVKFVAFLLKYDIPQDS